ncbi:putative rna-binding protein [Botrytis cinerea BcDW1]|nr:putative rna-binding protein [Botrytis cinerea BcDW1]
MTSEPPEFHTKIQSPLSPLPVHFPNPSEIPVLRNQIDPTFNMTTTHEPSKAPLVAPEIIESSMVAEDIDSPLSDTRFSDAYDEKDEDATAAKAEEEDEGDDYAMTFDSDGEEHSDSRDQSQAVDQESSSLPNTVPTSELPNSLSNHRPATFDPPNGPETQPAHTIPSLTIPSIPQSTAAQSSDDSQNPITKAETTNSEDPNGEIDIQQLLDNITANAEINAQAARPNSSSSSNAPPKGSSSLPTHASLPPRPQITQIPKRSNYTSFDDPHKYTVGGSGFSHQPNSYNHSGVTSSLVAVGAPGTATDPRYGLPPPPSVSFNHPHQDANSPKLYTQARRFPSDQSHDGHDNDDRPWGPTVQKKYDEFLDRERTYVTEGLWERFPKGSRLFIGNLPSEKLTKRDLFHVFHKYGELAQISIKQAFGFVQFHDAASCYKALEMEQGKEVRGRKMHLEVSKAQKNTRNAGQTWRRSQSPEQTRGNTSARNRNPQTEARGSGYNHNDRNQNDRHRSQPQHGNQRPHDGYRSGRSPSPSRNYRGREARDEYRSTRNNDSYDSRDRRRSRSPFSGAQRGSYRDRSPSPRTREANEDGNLQIPRREPSMVPDFQIILMAELDRGFVSWVEGELRGRGVKTEVMFLSPRLSLQAVIRRQILEGVIAVSQLDMRSQNASKIPLQVFDRSGGINAAVRFDEYQDLEPKIAAELVVRAKATAQRPQYAPNPAPTYQAPTAQPNANIANIMGQLDNPTLQKLLGTLNNMPQQQNAPAVAANSAVDLVSLLGGLAPQPQQAPQQIYQQSVPQAAVDPYANYNNSATYGQPAAQQNGQDAQQVQAIMAQLARYRQ